jgi:hypothetical protein
VGNYSNGLIVSHTWHVAAIENLEDASLVFGCRIGSLIQNSPHLTVALRRPAAAVHFRALFIPCKALFLSLWAGAESMQHSFMHIDSRYRHSRNEECDDPPIYAWPARQFAPTWWVAKMAPRLIHRNDLRRYSGFRRQVGDGHEVGENAVDGRIGLLSIEKKPILFDAIDTAPNGVA